MKDGRQNGDTTLKKNEGIEVVSPILKGDNEKSSYQIKRVCESLKYFGQGISERCGGHIHIGANYLTEVESWMNLVEIWGNTEKILYTICNEKGELPREGFSDAAKPISKKVEDAIKRPDFYILEADKFKDFLKNIQNGNKHYGINFVDEKKYDTVEFRLPNGTLNSETWIENINLFGGIMQVSEKLGMIQLEDESKITDKDKRLLYCFDKIKDNEIDEREKLEYLLELVIAEEDRDIYRERYEENNKLMHENPKMENEIETDLARDKVNLRDVFNKVFLGEDGISGQDYYIGVKVIEYDLEKEENQITME